MHTRLNYHKNVQCRAKQENINSTVNRNYCMYRVKHCGPSTEPWGKPLSTLCGVLSVSRMKKKTSTPAQSTLLKIMSRTETWKTQLLYRTDAFIPFHRQSINFMWLTFWHQCWFLFTICAWIAASVLFSHMQTNTNVIWAHYNIVTAAAFNGSLTTAVSEAWTVLFGYSCISAILKK